MQRILYLSDVDITVPGGAQESMKILMNELHDVHEFYLISPNGKKLNDRHIVINDFKDFILRGKNLLELLKLAKRLLIEIKKIKPDIIHIQMPSTLVIINFLLVTRLLDKNIKIIYTDRGVYGKYGRLTTLSINSIIKKANKIVTTTLVNRSNYSNLFKHFPNYEDKFEVVYNTAGKFFDVYENNKRTKIKSKYNLDNEFVLGFCGRYNEQKNWPLTKKIIETIKEDKSVKFVLVIGSDGTKDNYNEIVNYINDLKNRVGDNRIFSFVDITNKEMSEIYYAMDCFILTSKWESFGRTAVEAMSRKNVVIGTGVDGLSEVIGNRKFIFQTADEAVDIIHELKNNEKELKQAKEFFYTRYHKIYGYTNNLSEYHRIYNEV